MFQLRTVALLALCAQPLLGGVVLDGSFGTHGALHGPDFMITAPMGRLVNTNLFESFSQFNLNSSQIATFTGPSNVQNILARVTSGSPSSIDGTIDSDIHGANLFFMNPAGVIFGQHAQLDVSGSFAVTTANYLKLVGGGRFNANLGGQDTLTSAPVSSFGFLNAAPKGVSIVGGNSFASNGNLIASPLLNIATGKSFSIVAGDITMNGGEISGRGSRVNLVSVKSPGEAQLDATAINSGVDVTRFGALGTIDLANLASIGTPLFSGPISINCGTLSINKGFVSSTGPIQINARDGVHLSGEIALRNGSYVFSSISTHTSGAGDAGDIVINGDLQMAAGADIGTGKGGNVAIHGDSILIDGGGIFSGGNTAIHGDSILIDGADIFSVGNMMLSGNNIRLGGNSRFPFSPTDISTSAGFPGGDMTIIGKDIVIDGAFVASQPNFPNGGNSGNINIQGHTVNLINAEVDTSSYVSVEHGGNITITGQSVGMNGTTIFSTAASAGGAGAVTVNAGDLMLNGGSIDTSTYSDGQGGFISIKATTLKMINGATILSETQAGGIASSSKGNGGDISLTVGSLFIDGGSSFNGPSEISAESGPFDASGGLTTTGKAGDIRIRANQIDIVDGGQISASTFGSGAGGKIAITASSISISGEGSAVTAETLGVELNDGIGGNIEIVADRLKGGPGGEISASTSATGVGGSIDIAARQVVLNDFAISANTTAPSELALPVKISKLNVSFNIDQSVDQDLLIELFPEFDFLPPVGRTGGSLVFGVGGNGQNFRNTVLADNAPISIASGTAPFTGRFRPLSPLSVFDGNVANGRWVLTLFDFSDLHPITTILKSWSLSFDGITVASSDVPQKIVTSPTNPFGIIESVLSINIPAMVLPITPGKGGDVRVSADTLSLVNNASISANSTGPGASGSVQLQLGSLALDSNSFIASSNTGSGLAGSVIIDTTGPVTLNDGSSISTSADVGDAGSIDITSGGEIKLSGGSSITASAGANGGNITMTAPEQLVYLLDSSIKATAGPAGGNITIDPLFIVLDNSPISASATGQGGIIKLQSNFFFTSSSPITATGGIANGTVIISAPELDLGAELISLPISLLSAENQLQERCTALLRGDFSSFILVGRGGTEPEPDELQVEF